jgi:Ran GTPase-activating protein (RanGAP) involved in mRNA processing and transport
MYVVRPRSGAQRDMAILSDALKANNTYLTSLNLQGNRLKATEATELFQALALNTTLTELSLFDNNISDAGATELSKALVVNNALAKLDLAQNQIGDTGAAELSKALAVNTVLTMLNLYNKNIGDVGTLALGNTLRTRPLRGAGFELVGVNLRDCWEGLELPRAGRDWNNTEVLAYFDQMPIRRKIAFAMVSHARLGQESRWTDLDSNVMEMIFKFSLLD